MKKLMLVASLVLLFCFVFGYQNKAEKGELEKFRAQAALEEQNKEIAKLLFEAIDLGLFKKLNELLADDLAIDIAGLPEPIRKDMLFDLMWLHRGTYPDRIHVIEDVITDGGKVAVKLTQNGTHISYYIILFIKCFQGRFWEIPATEVKTTLPAMHLITIVDGEIKEWFAVNFALVENCLGFYKHLLGMELKPKEVKK